MIDVLIIDKSSQIEQGLSAGDIASELFDDEVKALNSLEQRKPMLILLHYAVRKEQTADYIRLIIRANPKNKVVVLADELSEKDVLSCLLAGAQGYQQLSDFDRYARRLVTVMAAGEVWITRKMTAILLESLRS